MDIKLPVNEGQEKVAASLYEFDLQLFADDGEGGGEETTLDETVGDDIEETTEDSSGGEQAEEEVVEPLTQTPEANAAFAQMRRELDAAKRELQSRDAWVAQNFGQTHGITTWAQYQAAIQHSQQQQMQAYQQQRERELAEAGYDVAAIREILRTDPEYQSMKQENAQLKQQMEAERQNIQVEQGVKAVMGEYEALRQEYGDLLPEITGDTPMDKVNDLFSKVDQKVIAKIQNGYTFEDAWISVHRKDIASASIKKGSQAALNAVNGRAHMKGTRGSGDVEAISIPAETLEMYQRMVPGKTYDYYLAHYKKDLKG